ncbi:MAG: inositol monophosphatase family protein [Peptidiphaga sp.]|jgi:inositol-1-monophosphatase|uniref:inositol monophosphatase family protein n=1 Tax=Peptidiphaga sp. TaxID=2848648 RepID=UPI000F0F02E1|nr:MAG: inositol monophosphatase [Actinomyces sp.]
MYTSHELARIAADAARQVGPYLIEAFSRPRTVELKADFHDVVTVHDKESQRRIADFLFAETPESFIVGEESSRMLTCDGRPGTPGEGDVVWYVDPIDGTSNFASGFDHWCVSIAAARGGALTAGVVYQPTTNTLYLADDAGALRNGQPMRVLDAPVEDGMIATEFPSARVPDPEEAARGFTRVVAAARSVRRTGSTALALAEVAAGHFLAAFNVGTHPWDVAAGALLVERAGGRYLGFDDASVYRRDPQNAPNFVATGSRQAALLALSAVGRADAKALAAGVWDA